MVAHSEITVLIVDDDEAFHRFVTPFLSEFQLLRAHNGWECVELMARARVDVVLLDLNLPDAVGLRVLENMRAEGDEAAVIVVSGYADKESVRRASAWGARVVLDKTYENCRRLPRHIHEALAGAADQGRRWDPHREHHQAFARLEQSSSMDMQRLVRAAREAARTATPVLIEGEPGSDRHLVARYIHACAGSAAGPFVAAVAVPGADFAASLFGPMTSWDDSIMAAADGGVLFLDQVHELDADAQRRLLRLITRDTAAQGPGDHGEDATGAERPVQQVRIVAGTAGDLERAVQGGAFAPALRASLGCTRLRIPPLRERQMDLAADLPALVARAAASMGVAPPGYGDDVLAALLRYSFPGNEQELRAMIESACARKPGQRLAIRDLLPGD